MRITWDAIDDRPYSSGISQGVLYTENAPGVAWNGLISVTAIGEQAQEARYFDGRKYQNSSRSLPFAGVIAAYTYPDEFESCIGISGIFMEQLRKPFSFTYRVTNEIHVVYNALVIPSRREYASLSEEIRPAAFEWAFTTLPEKIPGGKPSSHFVIMVDEAKPAAITGIEALLYGDDENDPSLPSVTEVINVFESAATLRITDNGDGTWTAIGPDTVVTMIDDTTFSINWSTVVIIDSTTFSVSSL
jgi:hypothetical protein